MKNKKKRKLLTYGGKRRAARRDRQARGATAYWNITMDEEANERFDKYRLDLQKESKKTITRAEFGRIMFAFWENSMLHHKNKIKEHKEEIEKHQTDLDDIKKLSMAG